MQPDQIEHLRDPTAYPGHHHGSVTIIQTHLSVVCLLGDHAWKLKKSIRLPFADFSSLDQRRHFCLEELRLNQRLCPDTYLDVVPLRQQPDGKPSFHPDASGKIVDYAVRMRRLPADRMLDVLLARDEVDPAAIDAIAHRMTRFHADADRSPETLAHGDPDHLRRFALANFDETRPLAGEHPDALFHPRLHAALQAQTRADFTRHLPTLRARHQSGHVVDGHGDLHARNICLTDPPAIYDCIEFEPAFRCGDVATEHAFMAMDLRFRGHPELGNGYLDAVVAGSGDPEIRDLMPALVRYRAMVRAKVSAIAATEPELAPAARTEAAGASRRYLRLAAATAIEEHQPWWLMLCGLPGSGKSSIAKALASASGGAWPVLSSDRIRKQLAGIPSTTRLPGEFYHPDFSRRTYAELRQQATAATSRHRVVILDANFRGRAERQRAHQAAGAAGARLAILQIDAPASVIMARLDRRGTDPQSESDANAGVYRQLVAEFEPPHPREADLLLTASGDAPPDRITDDILSALLPQPG